MGITFVLNKLKSLLLFIVAAFRKALCCLRRRKRVSFSEDDQLTHVGVVSNQMVNEFHEWSEWNDESIGNRKPQTIQEHIDYYRKKQTQIALEQQNKVEEVEQDIFEDMTPRITKQTKVLINSTNAEATKKPNISLVPDNVAYFGSELQEWEDSTGWDGDALDIDKAIRDSRKIAREKRAKEQQQKRLEKHNRMVPLATRIST